MFTLQRVEIDLPTLFSRDFPGPKRDRDIMHSLHSVYNVNIFVFLHMRIKHVTVQRPSLISINHDFGCLLCSHMAG